MSKPAPFSYRRAAVLEDVFAAFAAHGPDTSVLAGGQSLIPALNLRVARPRVLVDINGLTALGNIEGRDDAVRIGALARHAEVLASPIVATRVPLLTLAMPHVGHPAIRRRGTFGGSLCHADPSAEIPACVLAQDGRILLASTRGRRTLNSNDFLRGLMETACQPDELLIEVLLPASQRGEVVAFREICRRRGDFAIVGVAARAQRSAGRLFDLRLVVFGCERRPHLAIAAAKAVEGERCDSKRAAEVAELVAGELDPMDDANGSAGIKRQQAKALVQRVLADLGGGPMQ
jgi:carbon-monoxide dehydrogenase medium subunit